jgi:hypothetical protein
MEIGQLDEAEAKKKDELESVNLRGVNDVAN